MGTIAKACLQGSDLLVQQHFRWVQLRWDAEPMQGLLQRFLRRKVVNKVTDHTWPVVGRGSLTFPGIAVRQPGLELCHSLCGFWHVKIRGRQGSSGASLVAETVKNLPTVQEIWVCRRLRFSPWIRKIPWRRAWQPTPVSLPGKSFGQRNPVGCSQWGHKELDTTEQLTL